MRKLSIEKLKFIIISLIFALTLFQSAFCANFRVKDLIIDNSDRLITIIGDGNYKTNQTEAHVPIPVSNTNSVNLINNITYFTLTSPNRFIVDIPNAKLSTQNRKYEIKNSTVLKQIDVAQFSSNPAIVRIVFYTQNQNDLSKFKVYSTGKEIAVKYNSQIIDNSYQSKFYTPSGDMDKGAKAQDTYGIMTLKDSTAQYDLKGKMLTKYYLSQVAQNSDGLILRGIGQLSVQKATYSADNTRAEIILDSANLSSKLENKTYRIPSSNKNNSATLTLNTLNDRKIKLTLLGNTLRDYRLVFSGDRQSVYVSHRSYVLNTGFSNYNPKVVSYKTAKNANGYWIFDLVFDKPVTYDIFELNNSLYLDIDNLSDFNQSAFQAAIKNSQIVVGASKIAPDKTRYIIPMKDFNFSYGNIESNSKSVKLVFKEKPQEQKTSSIALTPPTPTVKDIPPEPKRDKTTVILPDKPTVVYVPKNETKNKKKENLTISSMKKVVIDAGHGGGDYGAIRENLNEKTLNLTVAKLIEEKLKKKNIYVYMTRSKDVYLTLDERTTFSNNLSPDIYVSIHTNATVAEDSLGVEVHYYKDDSLKLAQTIHKNLASEKNLKKWETKDRGVIKSRFYVINHTEAPSVLIEIGFISNLAERTKLQQKARQEEIADSIVKGILEYLKVK